MAYVELSQTLAESFNALADEVQTLADRKTVLEHKLRFAHEQVRFKIIRIICKTQTPPFTQATRSRQQPLLPSIGQASEDNMMSYLSSRS